MVSANRYEASVGPGREQTYWDVDHVPLRGLDGTVDGVLILADEVTHQVLSRRKVQELAQSLAQERDVLQTIMENTPAQLAYLDPEFNFVRVNAAYAEGSGHSKQELIGRNHFDLFPHAENQAIFERVRDTGQAVVFHAKPSEFPDRPELGTTYWDWTLVPVRNASGSVEGLVLSLLDVTELKRAQKVLGPLVDRLQLLREADQSILGSSSLFFFFLASAWLPSSSSRLGPRTTANNVAKNTTLILNVKRFNFSLRFTGNIMSSFCRV